MICRRCQSTLAPEWVACPHCGTAVAQTPIRRSSRHGNGVGGAYKRGNTWTARVTVGWTPDGVAIRKTKSGFRTKTEALQFCTELRENPVVPRQDESFHAIFNRWKEFYEPRIKESTMSCYKAAFAHFSPVAHRKITEITVAELQECVDNCGKGRSTLDDMRSVCSLVFKYAQQNRIEVDNPAPHLYCGSVRKGTRRSFTNAELEQIRAAVGVLPYADYVLCMCYLGFRPNEMLCLKKEAYDHEHQCLVGGFKTEAGTNRAVPISPKIRPIIDRLLSAPGDYIFPGESGEMLTDATFRRRCFNPLMQQLGIDGCVPYSCRHTFANLLKNVGGSDTDKAALIGHADASMTKYYQSADYESLQNIVDKI